MENRKTYWAVLADNNGETVPYMIGERKAIKKIWEEIGGTTQHTEKGDFFICAFGSTRSTKTPDSIVKGFYVMGAGGKVAAL